MRTRRRPAPTGPRVITLSELRAGDSILIKHPDGESFNYLITSITHIPEEDSYDLHYLAFGTATDSGAGVQEHVSSIEPDIGHFCSNGTLLRLEPTTNHNSQGENPTHTTPPQHKASPRAVRSHSTQGDYNSQGGSPTTKTPHNPKPIPPRRKRNSPDGATIPREGDTTQGTPTGQR